MGRPRILLADDQPEVIATVAEILSDRFEIVAAVGDGEGVMDAVARLNPDLLILDISMPILNGIEAARRLNRCSARPKIVFLTVHEDASFVEAAFSVGALGYVLKRQAASDLMPALREVLRGRVFTSPALCVRRGALVNA
jgi:DNA-binding NarL/FixJ family response regulator